MWLYHEADKLGGPKQRASGRGDDVDLREGGGGRGGRRRGVQPAQDPKGQADWSGKDAGGRHEQSERHAMLL